MSGLKIKPTRQMSSFLILLEGGGSTIGSQVFFKMWGWGWSFFSSQFSTFSLTTPNISYKYAGFGYGSSVNIFPDPFLLINHFQAVLMEL